MTERSVAALEAENARLRAALEKIKSVVGTSTEAWLIAHTALKNTADAVTLTNPGTGYQEGDYDQGITPRGEPTRVMGPLKPDAADD